MKKITQFLFMLTAVMLTAFTANIAAGSIIAAAPLTLDTQKIVFLTSLKEEYKSIDTWLNSTEDLSMFVEDGQTLVFPESGADPDVYVNRTTDVDSVEPTETVNKAELDVYDSQNYKIRNSLIHALPFNKIQHYTKKSADALVRKEIIDAAYSLAPDAAGTKKIVMAATGDYVNGYRSLILDDVITLAKTMDNAEFPEGEGMRNLVLPSDWWWSLVNSNTILKGQLERQTNTGVIDPKVVSYYGITIHKSLGNKLGVAYNAATSAKAAHGAAITGDVVPATFAFIKAETFRAGGKFTMFYSPAESDPEGRATTFGFQHRFKSGFQQGSNKYGALIYLPKQS